MAEVLGTAVLELTTSSAGLNRGLEEARVRSASVFGGLIKSSLRMAATIGLAFGAFKVAKGLFVDPIKSAGDFQQNLNVLQAVTGASSSRIGEMSKLAIKLGADLRLPAVSAQDAAETMVLLSKGGLNVDQTMRSVRATLLLSTAAQIDHATAAKAVTRALKGFHLPASDAVKVVDLFAGAANHSTAEIGDITAALTMSTVGFHAIHAPIQDAATAIALMANAGQVGGVSGASLNVALTKLASPTKKAGELMKQYGLHIFDAHGKFIGLRAAIAQFTPILSKMTDQQRLHTIATLAGTRGMRALNVILGGGTAAFDMMKAGVTRAGQAQQYANAQTRGFNGAMSGLKSTVETLQIQIGLALLPVLTKFVRFLSRELPGAARAVLRPIKELAGWFGIFQDKMDTSGPGMRSVAIAAMNVKSRFQELKDAVREIYNQIANFLGPILKTLKDKLSDVFNFISNNLGTAKEFHTALKAAGLAIGIMVTAIAAWIIVQTAINILLSLNPIMLVVIAIAALVFAMVELYQRSETARKIMDAMWAALKIAANAALGFITHTLIPDAIAAWHRFGPEVIAVMNAIKGGITTAMNFIKENWRTGWKIVQQAVQDAWIIIQAVFTVLQAAVDEISKHWKQAWSVIGPLVKAAFDAVKIAVTAGLKIAIDAIKVFHALLHGEWGKAWNALKDMVSTALNAGVQITKTILTGLATSAGNLAILVAKAIAAGIKTVVQWLIGLAGDVIKKIASACTEIAGKAYTAAIDIGKNLVLGVVAGIESLPGKIASSLWGAVSGGIGHVKNLGRIKSPSGLTHDEIGVPLAEGIIMGFVKKLNELGPQMGRELKGQIGSLVGVTKESAKPLIKEFKHIVEESKREFEATFKALTHALEAQFTAAKATIARFKAQLTPTELRIKLAAAAAELHKLNADVDAAWIAVNALPAAQAKAWAALLKQQKANIDALKATLQSSTDDAILAGNKFNKDLAKSAGDPLATGLIAAHKHFDETKKLFDQGLVSEAEFVAASNALDDARTAAADDADALMLDDDYTAWQDALKQQTAAGTALTDQLATDLDDQKTLQDQFITDSAAAWQTYYDARDALGQHYIEQAATRERTARDTEATELNTALVNRYNRIHKHLENVHKTTKDHYHDLETMATTTGHTITDNLAQALGDALNPNSSLAQQLVAVSNFIKKYLKTSSPTEVGPMSDLDHWWDTFVPTLTKGLDRKMLGSTISRAVNPTLALMQGGKDLQKITNNDGRVELTQHFHEQTADWDPVAIGAATSYTMRNLRT